MKIVMVTLSLLAAQAFAGEITVRSKTLMYPGANLNYYTNVENNIYWNVKEQKLCGSKEIKKIRNIRVQVSADFNAKLEKEEFVTQAATYPTVSYSALVTCD